MDASDNLKPAHEVILRRIATHCSNICGINESISKGGVMAGSHFLTVGELETGRSQEIGGLCSLLGVLEDMVIPKDKIPWMIGELEKLDCRHLATGKAMQVLSKQ